MSRLRDASDPCELPRESLFDKHYRAALLGDGCVLPIEERLGRRLLRVIEPESAEGRVLLRSGLVVLCRESSVWHDAIGPALDRLEREARERAATDPEVEEELPATLRELQRHRREYGV